MARFAMILLAAAAASASPRAEAGPLLIAPTTIQLEAGRRSAAIEVTNESDAPVDLQFRAYDWDQPDGRERLTPTQALAVSPAIATLPPHGKQVFRVLDLGTPDDSREHSYRLKLNELPRPTAGAIAVNLEFSLPVFRTPAGATPALAWSEAGRATVRIANRGTRRVRIGSLALSQPDGSTVPIPGAASSYLLVDSAHTFALPAGARIGAGTRLVGTSDTGPVDVPLATLAAG